MNSNAYRTNFYKLYLFAENGNIEKMTALIENEGPFDVECQDIYGNTLLQIASANNNSNIVNYLIKIGSDVNSANNFGWTSLMQACRYGHCNIIKVLLDHGAAFNQQNSLGISPLMLACASGNVESVRKMIDAGCKIDEDLDIINCQVSSLMVSSLCGNDNIVRLLLDKGVNANTATPNTGITALMFASSLGSLSTVEILLERGAKVDAVNVGDYSALDIAHICNNIDIENKLMTLSQNKQKKEKSLKDIMKATREENIDAVLDILLNDKSKANALTFEGATPLMVAAMIGNIKIAEYIIQFGANINAQDYDHGWTPLMQAIYHGHTEMAKYLIDKGADISIMTDKGYTAFDLANEKTDAEILKILAQKQDIDANEGKNFPISPRVQYIKNIWNKVLKSPELTPSRQAINNRRKSAPAVLPPLAKPEQIFKSIEPVTELVFNNLLKIQEESNKLLDPPDFIILPNQKGIFPTGSRVDHSNDIRYDRIIAKIKKRSNCEQKIINPPKYEKDSGMTASSFVKTPHIRVTFDNSRNTRLSNIKLLLPRIYSDSLDKDSISQSITSELEKLSLSLGEDQLSNILEKLKMDKHIEAFKEQEILDIETFIMLNTSDLKDLGIYNPHEIRLIMNTINKIKETMDNR